MLLNKNFNFHFFFDTEIVCCCSSFVSCLSHISKFSLPKSIKYTVVTDVFIQTGIRFITKHICEGSNLQDNGKFKKSILLDFLSYGTCCLKI